MTSPPRELDHSAFELTSLEIGTRLDRVLLSRFPELSRRIVGLAVAEGRVRVNGKRARKGDVMKLGDVVEMNMPHRFDAGSSGGEAAVTLARIEVCYQDEHLLIVNKPAGMPCHPLRPDESGTVVSGLLDLFPELASVGNDPREAGLVHRLDTDTSGLLLVARDPQTWTCLRDMLLAGAIDKTYVARCQRVAPETVLKPALYSAHLRANRGARVRVSTDPLGKGSRDITTEVIDLTELSDATTLIRVRVHRAARHQVRAHLAYLGFPLLGDVLYNGPPRQGGHLLQADTLKMVHPMYNRELKLSIELPSGFSDPPLGL